MDHITHHGFKIRNPLHRKNYLPRQLWVRRGFHGFQSNGCRTNLPFRSRRPQGRDRRRYRLQLLNSELCTLRTVSQYRASHSLVATASTPVNYAMYGHICFALRTFENLIDLSLPGDDESSTSPPNSTPTSLHSRSRNPEIQLRSAITQTY